MKSFKEFTQFLESNEYDIIVQDKDNKKIDSWYINPSMPMNKVLEKALIDSIKKDVKLKNATKVMIIAKKGGIGYGVNI